MDESIESSYSLEQYMYLLAPNPQKHQILDRTVSKNQFDTATSPDLHESDTLIISDELVDTKSIIDDDTPLELPDDTNAALKFIENSTSLLPPRNTFSPTLTVPYYSASLTSTPTIQGTVEEVHESEDPLRMLSSSNHDDDFEDEPTSTSSTLLRSTSPVVVKTIELQPFIHELRTVPEQQISSPLTHSASAPSLTQTPPLQSSSVSLRPQSPSSNESLNGSSNEDWVLMLSDSQDLLASQNQVKVHNRAKSFLEHRASTKFGHVDAIKSVLLDMADEEEQEKRKSQAATEANKQKETQTTGSAAGQRDSWDPLSKPKPIRSSIKRRKGILEIVTSENTYLEGLEHLIRNAMIPLMSAAGMQLSPTLKSLFLLPLAQDLLTVPQLDPIQVNSIFSNLESIYITNTELQSLLDDLILNSDFGASSTIGNVFIKFSHIFKCYCPFVDNLQTALDTINTLSANNPAFVSWTSSFKALPLSKKRTIDDFITTPAQRIPRYILLLTAVLDATEQDHPDFALVKEAIILLNSIADYINKSAQGSEKRKEVLNIQNRFTSSVELVAPSRLIVKEGILQKLSLTDGGSLQSRHVFLFSDLLVTATPVLGTDYLMLDKMENLQNVVLMDREDPEGRQTFFVLGTIKTYVMVCSSAQQKQSWTDAISHTTAELVSKNPNMEALRNSQAIWIDPSGTPHLIPVEAQSNPNHPVFEQIRARTAPSGMKNVMANLYSTVRGWFAEEVPDR